MHWHTFFLLLHARTSMITRASSTGGCSRRCIGAISASGHWEGVLGTRACLLCHSACRWSRYPRCHASHSMPGWSIFEYSQVRFWQKLLLEVIVTYCSRTPLLVLTIVVLNDKSLSSPDDLMDRLLQSSWMRKRARALFIQSKAGPEATELTHSLQLTLFNWQSSLQKTRPCTLVALDSPHQDCKLWPPGSHTVVALNI